MVIYITVFMIVLLNLVIARMSSTHQKIDLSSLEVWSKVQSMNVEEFVLIFERNPMCMLPAPLNLISIAAAVFDFIVYYIRSILEYNNDKNNNGSTNKATNIAKRNSGMFNNSSSPYSVTPSPSISPVRSPVRQDSNVSSISSSSGSVSNSNLLLAADDEETPIVSSASRVSNTITRCVLRVCMYVYK